MAIGSSTFSAAGGAVSDLFAGFADQYKAKGDRLEAQNYDLAAGLADQNAAYTEQSTAIKLAQGQRTIYQGIGRATADIAGAGFASSGSGLDILADSAAQGHLTQSVTQMQGDITEAGYKEQSQSYQTMSQAAHMAADAEDTAATGAFISGGIKGIAALATLA